MRGCDGEKRKREKEKRRERGKKKENNNNRNLNFFTAPLHSTCPTRHLSSPFSIHSPSLGRGLVVDTDL